MLLSHFSLLQGVFALALILTLALALTFFRLLLAVQDNLITCTI
jgi:hypothetical protein